MNEYLERQGQRIRRARRFKLLSQEALAEKLTAEMGEYFGDDAKISRIEQGKQDLTSHELHALSMVLEQPTPWLQGVDDDGFNPNSDMGRWRGSFPLAIPA